MRPRPSRSTHVGSASAERVGLAGRVGLVGLVGACQAPELPPCGAPARGCPAPSPETFVDPLVHVGRAEGPTFVEILDVVASGALIYACTGTQGLTVWDATGAGAPRLVAERIAAPRGLSNDRFPRCQHVAADASSSRVVITNRGDEVQPQPWLWLYDVSDPSRPRALAGWTQTAPVEGVVIEGARIFAAAHGSGVLALERTGSGELTARGTYRDASSDAWVPVLRGDVLYVAEGATGLRLYDVADDEPQLLATLPLPGSSRDVVLDGDLAYVADSAGLAVVDVSDPRAPRLRSQTDSAGTSLAVARGAGSVVLMAEWDQVRGYDVSDPSAVRPVFAEVVPTDAEFSRVLALDVDPARRRVYAGEWRGLQVFDHVEGGRGPDIETTPSVLQYGALTHGDRDARVVVVRNDGDRPLTVHDVVGGPGVSVDEECFAVPPGGGVAVEVTLAVPDASPVESGLKFCSDDVDEPEHTIPLTANVSGVSVGDPVPRFALTDIEGNRWSSEGLRGNVAVLAYFATF